MIIIYDKSETVLFKMKCFIKTFLPTEILFTTSSGEDAYSFIITHKPEILISDLYSNSNFGFDLITLLRKENSNIKIIALTDMEHNYFKRKTIELNIHYLLDKTKEFDKLENVISKIHT